MTKPLTLAIFQSMMPGGTAYGSWRHPENTAPDYLDVDHWVSLGKKLDAAGFDFLFFADAYGSPDTDDRFFDIRIKDAGIGAADPLVVVSAIAAATSKLGIVVTASTTTEKPQSLTRRYATLDHLTKGRIGWNIVTGSGQAASARLFGEAMIPHDERYLIAEDHIQLSLKLWEQSWDDGAILLDRAAGVYADPSKIHDIHHDGPYFKADGFLTVPPSPQRTPLLLQAGTSGPGRDFAAKYAEAVFLAGGDAKHVAANIADIRERAERYGRPADSIKFLVGVGFITAPTTEEAQAKRGEMLSFSTVESAAAFYATLTGIDLLALDRTKPLGDVKTEQGQSGVERFSGADGVPPATVGEILEDYRRNGVNGSIFVGDPSTVADQIEEFIELTGADGFAIQPYLVPGTYDDFIELLIPELRSRGLMREQPEGSTLREHLFGEGRKRLPREHAGAQLQTPVS
ncbi:NtaA/DmoA family FMN-dependent monooxygenase [Subtercola frigoramans]|uniref:FMN-dependent oxidoreductase (Nitrilotriacetate monooxygenase family) n=1 Tax=Subtercola frigoramans TaxID=120298 RepID=A0ABS2L131_9MICO|nr:NtaA/DmoA family FMN-dependent monooxygenase [Subtercola frigoramans]MBM7470783.1 FMN-dependent oxidoreductase (nitrilotriacetate monooxygenase family) [Subtercola frigoramans]